MNEQFYSRVYTDRPQYADYDSPEKFQTIQGIIMTRLREHPNAICSYSGGADSDILIDLIESCRKIVPSLPKVKYVFFNTGLEMQATKDHVKRTAEKYEVEIIEARPDINIVRATRKCGVPFVSKIMSQGLEGWQKKKLPLSIADEYDQAKNKHAKRKELRERYPGCESLINFLCCCNAAGDPRPNIQLVINSSKFMDDPEISDFGRWQHSNGFNTALVAVKCDLDKVPSIKPERKKGKWIEEDDGWDGVFWRCSEYNEPFYLVDGTPVDNEYHYCPNCGADMREEQDETD